METAVGVVTHSLRIEHLETDRLVEYVVSYKKTSTLQSSSVKSGPLGARQVSILEPVA